MPGITGKTRGGGGGGGGGGAITAHYKCILKKIPILLMLDGIICSAKWCRILNAQVVNGNKQSHRNRKIAHKRERDGIFSHADFHQIYPCSISAYPRADSRFTPIQWETVLLCNDVSHWLGASLESALLPVLLLLTLLQGMSPLIDT